MFPTQNLCPGSKNVFDSRQKTFFVFRVAKFVSATHVYRTAKLGNICIANNVSPHLLAVKGCVHKRSLLATCPSWSFFHML